MQHSLKDVPGSTLSEKVSTTLAYTVITNFTENIFLARRLVEFANEEYFPPQSMRDELITAVQLGLFDDAFRMYYALGHLAEPVADLTQVDSITAVMAEVGKILGDATRIKNIDEQVRITCNRIARMGEELRKPGRQTPPKLTALRQMLKDTSKPHELGTVREIAARYNVPISEVRRHKGDGTLEAWVQLLSQGKIE